jgi:phage terminase large subunit
VELNIQTTVSYQHLEDCNTRTIHAVGGTRSGKSYAIMTWLIVQALQEKISISVVRKSMPSLRRSVVKDFMDIMKGFGIWDLSRWHDTKKEYTFDSDAVISFFSADDESKLRGVKSDYAWIDEASEVSSDEAFQIGIRTTRRIIYSYNPTVSPYHWLRQEYGDSNVTVKHTTYLDNPFLEEAQIKAIEDLKEKNPKLWAIYGRGEYAGNERQIYQFNVIDEIPNDADFVAYGLDFGFNDPTAMVGLWKWGENIYIKEILYERSLTSGDIVSRLRHFGVNREEIWCDSADARLIEELYRSGLNAKAVSKGPNSINFGINTLLNYRINLHKGSQNLINEMYGYQWASDKSGYVTDVPEGGLDHLLDAARYVGLMKLTKKAENSGKYVISIR